MSAVLQDLRYGVRLLFKNPGFSAISVLTLGLGIGLTAMMFSLVYGAILRGLPFEDDQELMHLEENNPSRDQPSVEVGIHDYEEWRAQQGVFEDLAAFYTGTVNISGSERAERFDGGFVTANTFGLLRVRPILGRDFREGEDLPGAEPVILLGYDVWRNRYLGDPQIVGKTIRANGKEAVVIGVMPDRFHFPYTQSVWVPLGRSASTEKRGDDQITLEVFGRLKDGTTLDRASTQMGAIARRLAMEYPETNEGVGATVKPFAEEFIGEEPRALLFTMLGAVFLVLLIACANVANLLLSQAALRVKEIGVRSALGASRSRLVVQFLAEPLALAVAGAVLGVGIAWFALRLFTHAIADTNPPYWLEFGIDGPVLLFVLGTALFSTLAAGVLPALQAAGGNTGEILKDESRSASSFRLGRISRALVVFEIALSCGLLVAAGLMIKSVAKLRTIDFGFSTEQVFTARVGLPESDYPEGPEQARYFEELHEKLRTVPNVESVSLSESLPGLGSARDEVGIEGVAYATDRDYPTAHLGVVAPGSFDAFGVSVLQGRDFGEPDREGSLPVALVNESFVRKHFPDGSVLGRRIRVGDSRSEEPWRSVVGVVPDMHMDGVENREPAALYTPLSQTPRRFMSIVARSRGAPLALTPAVRDAVAAVDADIPLYFVETLASRIATNTWFYRVFGTIFMVMGFVALFLAAIGLYGVMAFSVSRRTREMGVRMALGARGRDVEGLVLRQGMLQLAVGLSLGLALAAGVSQLLAFLLFEVQPRDPAVFGSILGVLAVTGLLASWIPARRATRVDPMVALRTD